MAFKHLVLVKFREGISAEEIIKKLEDMASEINEIKALEWGQDVDSEEMLRQGFTHAFSLTFESKEGFVAYAQHPSHIAFAEIFLAAIEKILVFDFNVATMNPPNIET